MEWQRIETAPIDGTWVLLTGGELWDQRGDGREHPCVVAQWRIQNRAKEWGGPFGEWFVAQFDGGCGEIFYYDATHWMPIPPPAR
jgi:hypothetical protein